MKLAFWTVTKGAGNIAREYKEKLKGKIFHIILIVVIAFVISSIWAVSMYFSHSNYFLEILKKEGSTWSTKHTRSVFFYLDYFIYLCFIQIT